MIVKITLKKISSLETEEKDEEGFLQVTTETLT